MSKTVQVVVPDLGDFDAVEVIEVEIAVGDTIALETPLLTLETDKATMDVPSDVAGVVKEILVSTGDRVSKGTPVAVVEVAEDATKNDATPVPSAADAAPSPAAAPEPSAHAVNVPDIGDFDNVEVIELMVAVGDTVEAEDALITLETDKATMDVPSPISGKVTGINVKAGDTVSKGSHIVTIEGVAAAAVPAPSAPAASAPAPAKAAPAKAAPSAVPAAPASAPATLPAINEATFGSAHAGPSTRKFARELGVDLARVQGSGVKGRITTEDIKRFVKTIMAGGGPVASGPSLPEVPKIDFSKFGEVEEVKLTRVQKISGKHLQASWINLPHVTQHDEADFTATEDYRQANKVAAREQGIKLTPLAFIMRACVLALGEFPRFNTSLNADGDALVHKKYTHMGFAADTPDGLLVPVVHDAQKMGVHALATSLAEMAGAARDGKLKAKDMQGGSFTISSLGGIGGKYFTPIINAPEVAILGVSKSSIKPVYIDGSFEPRLMLPLSLSYDHRVIDGALAARFITRLGELLGDPDALMADPS
ncbi:MAG: dihydrolipoyllysine-residue acetyltransferase [Gammaproteobacteria bacterium]